MPHPPSSSHSPLGRPDVELARRLGEREVARPQARREPGPEERLGERLDRAGEVGEGDVAVDDEPFDLVEHGHVGGVGRVAPEAATRDDDVQRRLLGEHGADLDRRRVGAQHGAALLGAGVVDEEGVPVAARRVVLAHVEGAEVVPVGLHLGALGNLEAEADEHVLEPFPRLGDEVGVTTARPGGELREVEPLGLDPAGDLGAGEVSRRPAIAAATASTASLRRCPVVRRSSTVASPPRRALSWARSPRLPSSWESRATISSTVLAAAIFSRAASRAAAMSSITRESFRLRVVGQNPG